MLVKAFSERKSDYEAIIYKVIIYKVTGHKDMG